MSGAGIATGTGAVTGTVGTGTRATGVGGVIGATTGTGAVTGTVGTGTGATGVGGVIGATTGTGAVTGAVTGSAGCTIGEAMGVGTATGAAKGVETGADCGGSSETEKITSSRSWHMLPLGGVASTLICALNSLPSQTPTSTD
jgi:hypothetical protein